MDIMLQLQISGITLMATAQKMLILPLCGFCGRKWHPPE
jgi:hypothetical protein